MGLSIVKKVGVTPVAPAGRDQCWQFAFLTKKHGTKSYFRDDQASQGQKIAYLASGKSFCQNKIFGDSTCSFPSISILQKQLPNY